MLKALFSGFVATAMFAAVASAQAAPLGLSPASLASGEQVDTAPLGTRTPLVLVHGLGGSGDGWTAFLQAWQRNPAWRAAFKPYLYHYASSASEVLASPTAPRSISGLGAALRDALQSVSATPVANGGFGGKSVMLLGHSMGGLVARSMMQEHTFADGTRGGERVLRLVTLGTPHHGSPLADAGFALGLDAVPELQGAYAGLVNDLAWTNYDALNMGGGRCNAWLARLNNYAPAAGSALGNCGSVAATALPGFYDRVVAVGSRALQQRDLYLGGTGIYKPGSPASMLVPYAYLAAGLPRSYANDGIVPLSSAFFDGVPLATRMEAFQCDHRYLERGYGEVVRTSTATYSDWAFCAASNGDVTPSGTSGGWATGGTIMAAIADLAVSLSEAERVLDWAEQAYAPYLQPAGARTAPIQGYQARHYAGTEAYVGVKDGQLFYLGPASGGRVLHIGAVADLLASAQAAGY